MNWIAPRDAARSSLGAPGPVLQYAQDCGIYDEGEPAESFLKVVSGVVRTCKFLQDGRRQIDAFLVPGDIFGLESGAAYSLTAEAVSDCTLIAYRWRTLAARAANDEDLTRQLLAFTLRSLTKAQDHARLLGRASALEKVAAFIIEWSAQSPDRKSASLVMARQDIADYLGLTVETISRTLTQLRLDQLIELRNAREIRVINLPVLRAING
jgi:CRP/FNR family nitrogen fixation transcriptional regulator